MKKLLSFLFLFVVLSIGCQQSSPTNSSTKSDDTKPKLALVASSFDRSKQGFITIVGQVQNIGSDSLDNVQVILNSYGENKKVLTTEKAAIEIKNLTPNQTSPFQVTAKHDPNAKRHLITFASADGKELKYTQNDEPIKEN